MIILTTTTTTTARTTTTTATTTTTRATTTTTTTDLPSCRVVAHIYKLGKFTEILCFFWVFDISFFDQMTFKTKYDSVM